MSDCNRSDVSTLQSAAATVLSVCRELPDDIQFHHHLLFMIRLDSLHRTYFVTCSVGLADVSSLRLRCSVREG